MKFLLWLSSECASLREIVSALKKKNHDVGVLLLQNGVFLADKGCEHSVELEELGVSTYAVKEHVEERGIKDRLIDSIDEIDYSGMVDLVMERYDRVISV
ncbi:MAG: sulfurtransferase complex subunit TusB [Candidatus Thorarchaeota archaeon]|jgi:sulfur relay protein TusB/DsrH